MRIPPDAILPEEKITQYLLVSRPKDDQSKFLALAGFTLENATKLREAIVNLINVAEAIEDGSNRFGVFYRAEGILAGVNGINLSVVTIWIQRYNDNRFQFVTLKPKRNR